MPISWVVCSDEEEIYYKKVNLHWYWTRWSKRRKIERRRLEDSVNEKQVEAV
jgi:hypothetical protein